MTSTEQVTHPSEPSTTDTVNHIEACGVWASLRGDRLTRKPREHAAVGAIDEFLRFFIEVPSFATKSQNGYDRYTVQPDFEAHADRS